MSTTSECAAGYNSEVMSFATLADDDRLAALLAELAEQQRRGLPPDVEAAARDHPDLADELRALWATAQFAAAFALRLRIAPHSRDDPGPGPAAGLVRRLRDPRTNSAAAGWASSTRPGSGRSTGSSPSR